MLELSTAIVLGEPLLCPDQFALVLAPAKDFSESADNTIRDTTASTLFKGPGAAFIFRRIAVRDYAAEQFACVLGMPDRPNPAWKETDWANLRRQVRARLAALEKVRK